MWLERGFRNACPICSDTCLVVFSAFTRWDKALGHNSWVRARLWNATILDQKRSWVQIWRVLMVWMVTHLVLVKKSFFHFYYVQRRSEPFRTLSEICLVICDSCSGWAGLSEFDIPVHEQLRNAMSGDGKRCQVQLFCRIIIYLVIHVIRMSITCFVFLAG